MGEWFFALFLFAGNYKADPRLAIIQKHIDLTVLLLVLSFCVLIYRIYKKSSTLRLTKSFFIVAILFILLSLLLIGSLFYTGSKQYGYEKALKFLVLTGWAFFGAGFLISDILSLRKFSWAIVTISLIMVIDAISGYKGLGNLAFITALGSNYIALARAAGFGLLTNLVFLLPAERNRLFKLILYGIMILQIWATMSAGARGPVIALIPSFILFFALSAKGFPILKIERHALRLGVVLLIVFSTFAVFGRFFFLTLNYRFQILMTEGDISALTRLYYYRESLDSWLDSPIWGHGVGAFSTAVIGEDIREYPHNIIMELAVETGLVGVMIFTMMLIKALANPFISFRNQEGLNKRVIRYLLVLFCFAFLNAMVSGDINDNRILFTWIALVANISRFQNNKSESLFQFAASGR